MATGTTVTLIIIAAFLAIITFLVGAILLRLDTLESELRRRLGHIDNKLAVMGVDHETARHTRRLVEAHSHRAQGWASR